MDRSVIITTVISEKNRVPYNFLFKCLSGFFGISIKSTLFEIQMPIIPRTNPIFIKFKKYETVSSSAIHPPTKISAKHPCATE